MKTNGWEKNSISQRFLRGVSAFLLIFLAAGVSGIELWGEEALEIPVYNMLKASIFTEQPVPLPEDGISWKRDVASWHLEKGKLFLMKPMQNGTVCGMVFLGKGRFRMSIPDWVEREQFQRCSGKKNVDNIDDTFSKMVLRTSDTFIGDLIKAPSDNSYSKNGLADRRRTFWIKYGSTDIDARVTAGMFNPDDRYLWVEMKTETFGWIAFVFDKFQQEEVQLQNIYKKYKSLDIWVSLDRASDRDKNGRPTSAYRHPVDIQHMDIQANLTGVSLRNYSPWGSKDSETATFSSTVRFVPTVEGNGHRMLEFQLSSRARILGVTDQKGNSLPFIRTETHSTIMSTKNIRYDWALRILLKKPLTAGETRNVTVDYEMDITNFVSGSSWYPSLPDISADNTVHLTARLRKKMEIMAVGKCVRETVEGGIKESVWHMDTPAKIYGFTLGKRFDKESIKLNGVPEVISFGTERRFTTGNMVRNVAIDVAKGMQFYQWFYDFKFPDRVMFATYIESNHGQAFQDFIHLPAFTYHGEQKGYSELFRTHEVAHQMWGHQVCWKTYRDQWLSESFAEYSSLLYIELAMKNKKLFNEALKVYTEMVTGVHKSVFSHFVSPVLTELTSKHKRDRDQIGPISIGTRASVREVPLAYKLQNYHKGPLVLHMMRIRMRNATGDDKMFRNVLIDFLRTYQGKSPCTDDFKRIVEKHTQSDWTWFFDQWLHGNHLPTYRWNYKVGKKNGNGKFPVTFTVKQENVPDGFQMPVPVRVVFRNKQERQFNMPIKKREQSFTLEFPDQPKKVIFNPEFAVLAKVKKL